jgi:hypothetical protein
VCEILYFMVLARIRGGVYPQGLGLRVHRVGVGVWKSIPSTPPGLQRV